MHARYETLGKATDSRRLARLWDAGGRTSSHLEPAVSILLHTPGAAELGERSRAGEVNAPLVVV